MKTGIFIFIIIVIIRINGITQIGFSRYFDLNFDNDVGWKIIWAKDKYYVLSGSFCHQNTIPCSGLFCFDNKWNLIWKKELDSLPPQFMDCITTDNEYLYITTSTADYAGYDFKLLKYDLEGNLIKFNYYGPYINQRIPYTINYYNNILYFNLNCRHNPSTVGYDSTEIWYLNTDFELLYSFTETNNKKTDNMIGYLPTKDSNFIGFKSIESKPQTTLGIVKKFDNNGKLIWESFVNGESKYPLYYSLQKIRPTIDNGCVGIWNQTYEGVNSDTFPEQPILFKLDSNGKVEWTHTFFSKRRKYLYSLFETRNGDIVGVGIDENPGLSSRYKSTGWVVRFSKTGNLIWEYSYIDSTTINGFGHFYDGIETEDENLVYCGTIRPKRDSTALLHHDIWVVKTDKYGCLIPTCDTLQVTTKIINFEQIIDKRIEFTNPVINKLTINSIFNFETLDVKILSLNGQTLFHTKNLTLPTQIDLSEFSCGIYFISFYSQKDNFFDSSKLIKL